MVVCLSDKPHCPSRSEALDRARYKRMLEQVKLEMFNTPEDYELEESGEYAEARLEIMRNPVVSESDPIEAVVQQVSSGQWNNIVLPRQNFKASVRKIWATVGKDLFLESKILDCLTVDGNGGLRVESILSRLLAAGVLARFAVVRDALGHLCNLCLVEHAYGQFSIRDGMLGDKAFKCLTV